MKHLVRPETPDAASRRCHPTLPTRLKIVHEGSGQEFVQPLQWSGAGRSALTTWSIPPAAKLGVYDVVLERERGRRQGAATTGGARAHLDQRQLPRRGVPPAAGRRALSGPKAPLVAPASCRSTCS